MGKAYILVLFLGLSGPLQAESHEEGKNPPRESSDVATRIKEIKVSLDSIQNMQISRSRNPDTGKTVYKVLMSVKGQRDWQEFDDYQAAKDFAEQVRKKGHYLILRFTPPRGPTWDELLIK